MKLLLLSVVEVFTYDATIATLTGSLLGFWFGVFTALV